MKLSNTNNLFTHFCGERVTNKGVLGTFLFILTLLFICGMCEGILS